MTVIKIETVINCQKEICFDLSRSVDLHTTSMSHTKEKAVLGVIKGVLNINDSVTWEAFHFGIKMNLTSKITSLNFPDYFEDRQIQGPFKLMIHQHSFETLNQQTVMTDYFQFKSPFGILGYIADNLILTKYLTKLLDKRNSVIKYYAESGKWKEILNDR